MCFFRDEKYQLKINLYNITFYPEYNITLEKTTNKTEDENLFLRELLLIILQQFLLIIQVIMIIILDFV